MIARLVATEEAGTAMLSSMTSVTGNASTTVATREVPRMSIMASELSIEKNPHARNRARNLQEHPAEKGVRRGVSGGCTMTLRPDLSE